MEVVKYGGVWACVVIQTVFAAFTLRFASPKNCTSLSNNFMISWETLTFDFAPACPIVSVNAFTCEMCFRCCFHVVSLSADTIVPLTATRFAQWPLQPVSWLLQCVSNKPLKGFASRGWWTALTFGCLEGKSGKQVLCAAAVHLQFWILCTNQEVYGSSALIVAAIVALTLVVGASWSLTI